MLRRTAFLAFALGAALCATASASLAVHEAPSLTAHEYAQAHVYEAPANVALTESTRFAVADIAGLAMQKAALTNVAASLPPRVAIHPDTDSARSVPAVEPKRSGATRRLFAGCVGVAALVGLTLTLRPIRENMG